MSTPDIVMYTTPICPYCVAAKSLLKQKGASWREIDITKDAAERDSMMARTGRRTVPQIFVGDRHIGGFDELAALDRDGGLDSLLGVNK
ncbi:MAG: glutaredoxin 3 [Gammaproteobacteria bacterium]|nr:glutaredoxin 3 [Gammaproteobacteria bacterium]